jgi:hypothetical protein
MRDRAIVKADFDHGLTGGFTGLANSFDDLGGFAMTDADFALFIASSDKGGKFKAPTAFNHFSNPIYMNYFLFKFWLRAFEIRQRNLSVYN